jgi:hypothetical protein
MNKAIFGGALACVLFLLVGTFMFPTNSIMWLAGTALPYTIFRIIAAIGLAAVLITNPPRKMHMRVAMGVVAAILTAVGVGIGASDSVHVLDMVLFILLGIAFAIEALEFNEEELEASVLELREEYARQAAPTAKLLQFQAERTVAATAHGLT